MLHLLHQPGQQGLLVLDERLGHGVEVSLIGRAAALGHAYEAVLSTLHGLDINLGRQVALRVHLVVHVQRGVLRVAEVVLREGVEDA